MNTSQIKDYSQKTMQPLKLFFPTIHSNGQTLAMTVGKLFSHMKPNRIIFLMAMLNGLYFSLTAPHFHQYSVTPHHRAQVSPEQCHRYSEQQQLAASCDIWSSSQQCPLTATCPKYREYAEYGHARDWWVASERLQSSKKNVGGAVGALPPGRWSAFEVSRC